jgi:hypothetical protein
MCVQHLVSKRLDPVWCDCPTVIGCASQHPSPGSSPFPIEGANLEASRWRQARPGYTLVIGVAFAAPANASFTARHKGTTSDDGRLLLRVKKNDQGERRVSIGVHIETTCEDGTIGLGPDDVGYRRVEVADDGTFSYHFQTAPGGFFDNRWVDLTGDIGFRHAEGTFEFRYTSLNDEGEAQLCGTGSLTWTAERQSWP